MPLGQGVVYDRGMKIASDQAMSALGAQIAAQLHGGQVIELIGDVGAGKTTFTKGLARGLGIAEAVQSPTFTISRRYQGKWWHLAHYDFYRLDDAGIMQDELAETLADSDTITVIEWAGSVAGILPAEHITITITADAADANARHVHIQGINI